METLNQELLFIKIKFPGHTALIDKLYKGSADFRALCKDYFLCMNVLDKNQKEFSEKQNTLKEYIDLRIELEKELADFMKIKKTGESKDTYL
jgi:hypothetical protein